MTGVDIDKLVDEAVRAVTETHNSTAQSGPWKHLRRDEGEFRKEMRQVVERHLFGEGSSLSDLPGVSEEDVADFCDECDCHYDTRPATRYGAPDHFSVEGVACCRHNVALAEPCSRCAQLLSWVDDPERYEREGPKAERPMLPGVSAELPSDAKTADEIVKTLGWDKQAGPTGYGPIVPPGISVDEGVRITEGRAPDGAVRAYVVTQAVDAGQVAAALSKLFEIAEAGIMQVAAQVQEAAKAVADATSKGGDDDPR